MIGKRWWTLCAVLLPVALLSCVTHPPAASGPASSGSSALRAPFVGQWAGSILVGAQSIQVQIRLRRGADGVYTGRINIPQQDAYDLPLSDILVDRARITFTLKASSDTAFFDGTLAGEEISGAFSQGPSRGTFRLSPASPLAVKGGGQGGGAFSGAGWTGAPVETDGTPIELRTPTGTIYGTLDLPAGAGPYPVVLIIAGSGPTNRDGNSPLLSGRNDCLKKLAIALKGAGFASVRYDKRGVGQSAPAAPDEASLRFDTYVSDAIAWIRMLEREPRFAKVAVVGHSEGSLIGMLAALRANADAFVSLDGAGAPASVELKRQLADLPPQLRGEAFGIIDRLVQGRLVSRVEPQLASLFRPSVQPFLISWFHYDPTVEIAKLHIPVLIVQGTRDLQIQTDDARKLHEAAPGSQLAVIRGMNHVLVEAPEGREGNLATYGDPNLPLAHELVATLVGFLRRALG